jgi:hypothetical protein
MKGRKEIGRSTGNKKEKRVLLKLAAFIRIEEARRTTCRMTSAYA